VRVGFRVNNRTRFERIAGFPGLRHGLAVEVSAGPTDAVGSHARSSAATPTRATTTAAATATTATTDPRPGAGAARHPPAPA
jgi:hypothetical protein